jgi:hypothetical protein
MPSRTRILLLLLLAACGGDGSDVTSPPVNPPPQQPQQYTLTVTGTGPGGGRIQTSAGVQPALDCSLAPSGQATGTCSAAYPAGMVVELTVTPTAGFRFDSWSGDAALCSIAATCSLTMSQNRSAVARLSLIPAPVVQIISSAYYPDPDFAGDGAVIWVVEARNNGAQTVESAEINFTSHDASGAVLASDFTFVGPIPPGETRASQSFADYLGTEASVDVQVGTVRFATEDPGLSQARITSSNWRVDPEFAGEGAIIWTVEVQNDSDVQLEAVEVDIVTHDASGKIVTTDLTFVSAIPPGERRSAQSFADYHGNEASAIFQIANVR